MAVIPEELLADVARMFGLLADQSRLRILQNLHEQGELAVGDIADRSGLTMANASQHLSRLAMGGLIARRKDGKSVLYRISDPRVEQLCDLVCSGMRERVREQWAALEA